VETQQCVLCVCVCFVELRVRVSNVKISTVAQKCFYVDGNEERFGFHVKFPMVHKHRIMLVCSWPSLDVRFGQADRNDR
jgi:hypothetical protein